ncbi:hypothetical protein ACQW02_20030 [Humitalea sp. 24SJ18S-53]|uniref:hypothetical protein n=1 Tax=Humitalea sp. 24SJ18S-53 TaxID=3422307 RepID=UPI003D679573
MSEAKPTKRVSRVIYRNATFQPTAVGLTLEVAIRRTLASSVDGKPTLSSNWQSRRMITAGSSGEDECLLINHVRDTASADESRSYIFGELVGYRPGSFLPLLLEAEHSPELDIDSVPAPDRQQFLDALTFWLIIDDHVMVVQGANARRRQLEDYLAWLLAAGPHALFSGTSVVLIDKMALTSERRKALGVKSITIGPPPANGRTEVDGRTRVEVVQKETDVHRDAALDTVDRGVLRRILDVVIADHSKAERLLSEIPPDQEVNVKVRFGFRRSRKSVERVPLDAVSEAVRNLEDQDISIETDDGQVSGDSLRVSQQARIAIKHGLLDREDVLRAMISSYKSFVEKGYIKV